MKKFCLLISCVLCAICAQAKIIKGNVTDQAGETIISASVVVKGTSVGTITDLDGNYELDGKSINLSTKIWHKYRQDPAISNAWVMDSIYGLYPGETKPASFNKNTYPFYLEAEQLHSRQYWPIFPHYISASNAKLWNNYGY